LADLDPVTIVFIYIAYFAFLLFLLGFGEVQGGEWQTVAQGVAKFIRNLTAAITGRGAE